MIHRMDYKIDTIMGRCGDSPSTAECHGDNDATHLLAVVHHITR